MRRSGNRPPGSPGPGSGELPTNCCSARSCIQPISRTATARPGSSNRSVIAFPGRVTSSPMPPTGQGLGEINRIRTGRDSRRPHPTPHKASRKTLLLNLEFQVGLLHGKTGSATPTRCSPTRRPSGGILRNGSSPPISPPPAPDPAPPIGKSYPLDRKVILYFRAALHQNSSRWAGYPTRLRIQPGKRRKAMRQSSGLKANLRRGAVAASGLPRRKLESGGRHEGRH